MTGHRTALILVGLVTCPPILSTQAPAFEVASIKRADPGQTTFDQRTVGDTYTATNLSLRSLIQQAYAGTFLPAEIIGGPGWVDSDRFSIVAKMSRPNAPFGPPLRELLGSRFSLRTHEETREMPVYRLVIARGDKRPGPKLSPSTMDCAAALAARNGPVCGSRYTPGVFTAKGTNLSMLSGILGAVLLRRVVESPDLTGNFDIDLRWDPNLAVPSDGTAVTGAGDVPSIFTALKEQLGLRLESEKAPTKVLVIDSVDHPTEN